ncbi:MAG: helix-turn-helix domain-containing protein [Bauldia litoralis]
MTANRIERLVPASPRDIQPDNPCAACAVRDLSVCGALRPDDVSRLNAIVTHKLLQPGEMLFLESDPANSLFVITDGSIKLYKMLSDGRRQITGFLFRSDFLGLAFRDRYAYSAEALSLTTVCRFPKDRLEALLDEFPEMERRLLSIASNELASAQDQMLLLGRKTAEEKLASFLWLLSRRATLKELDGKTIDLPMTRMDMADYLGLTIETVSRSFSALRRKEIIAFTTPQRMQITDLSAMAALAGIEEDSWDAATALR